MLPSGLSAADVRVLEATLRTSHEIRASAALLNLDGEVLRPLTLLDGQVDVDATATPTRSASVELLDPPDLGPHRMLRLSYGIRCPFGWFDTPVFTGVFGDPERRGRALSVQAFGKESLVSTPVFAPVTLPRRMRTDHAISVLLREHAGETRLDLPDMPQRLGRDVSLAREDPIWPVVKRLARDAGRQVFYNARGWAKARRVPGNVQWVFRDGEQATLTSVPSDVIHAEDAVNVVKVIGGVPKGAKRPVRGRADAPAGHRFSARKLGRGDPLVPRYLPLILDRDNILTVGEANDLAERELRDGLRRPQDAAFDALPNPLLEELDLVRVASDDLMVTIRLQRFSLRLRPAAISVGAHKVLTR